MNNLCFFNLAFGRCFTFILVDYSITTKKYYFYKKLHHATKLLGIKKLVY